MIFEEIFDISEDIIGEILEIFEEYLKIFGYFLVPSSE